MDSLNTALMLLAVGMGTVFFILLFIIYFSKGLILFINRFIPEEQIVKKDSGTDNNQEIPPKTLQVIQATIERVAKGARITNIKKIK
ncbi:MAG: OadG family protein [Bacteroidales bacterium]|nr:OadG family protein [Bacteroidales bacterium]